MANKVWIVLAASSSFFAVCQEKKLLQGKVLSANAPVPGVFIINKTTGNETKTDGGGMFSIAVRDGEKLAIYGSNIITRDFTVTESAFNEEPYVLEVQPKGAELDEVVISHINPESLGLVPKGQKIITQRDRQRMKYSPGRGLTFLINAITGKLKDYKRARATIDKEELAEKIDALVTDAHLEQAGIPREMAKGFVYYVVEDKRIASTMKSNASEIKILLAQLAEEYIKLQAEK